MPIHIDPLGVFKAPAEFVDSDHARVIAVAKSLGDGYPEAETAVRIFDFVRDLRYGAPDFDSLDSFRAGETLVRGAATACPRLAPSWPWPGRLALRRAWRLRMSPIIWPPTAHWS